MTAPILTGLLWGTTAGLFLAWLALVVQIHLLPAVYEKRDVHWLHRQNRRIDRTRPRVVELRRNTAPTRLAPAGLATGPAGAPSSQGGRTPSPALAPTSVGASLSPSGAPTGLQAVHHG